MLGKTFRKWTTRILDLPQDVMHDIPRLTMIGNEQLIVENHRGVQQFSETSMRLSLPKGHTMEISGEGLVIRNILAEEVWIEGLIREIKYIQS